MKKLFIHFPLFRLLCPFFSGSLVYVLILLINNNIEQIFETFLGRELYICIGLSFIIQEFVRLSIVVFDKVKGDEGILLRLLLLALIVMFFNVLIVLGVMNLYFNQYLGYSPNMSELVIFSALFTFITLVYLLLYTGHHFLHKVNFERLEIEQNERIILQEEFANYKREINTGLLYDCLEALIILAKTNPKGGEVFVDHFCKVYRYALSQRRDEFVGIHREIEVARSLLFLFDNLPFRRTRLKVSEDLSGNVIPGTLLTILEKIIRSTIVSEDRKLEIFLEAEEEFINIRYENEESLKTQLIDDDFQALIRTYSYYSKDSILVKTIGNMNCISVPNLKINEGSYN